MSKWTPGPWAALPEESDRNYIRVRGTVLGCRFKIANVLSPSYDGAGACEANETQANARLIAAAPELLEALKLCAAVCAGETMSKGGLVNALEAARAAIAKATGASA